MLELLGDIREMTRILTGGWDTSGKPAIRISLGAVSLE